MISDIETKIGVAVYSTTTNEADHQYLGNETQFNVYTAELIVIHLAIKLLRNHVEYWICCIYIDSQATIRTIDHP
jgi:hypothetical protein